jgi:hypothetical protein
LRASSIRSDPTRRRGDRQDLRHFRKPRRCSGRTRRSCSRRTTSDPFSPRASRGFLRNATTAM